MACKCGGSLEGSKGASWQLCQVCWDKEAHCQFRRLAHPDFEWVDIEPTDYNPVPPKTFAVFYRCEPESIRLRLEEIAGACQDAGARAAIQALLNDGKLWGSVKPILKGAEP